MVSRRLNKLTICDVVFYMVCVLSPEAHCLLVVSELLHYNKLTFIIIKKKWNAARKMRSLFSPYWYNSSLSFIHLIAMVSLLRQYERMKLSFQGDNTTARQHWPSRFANTTTTLQRQPPEGGPSAASTSTLSLRRTKAESHVLQQMPFDEEQGAVRSNRRQTTIHRHPAAPWQCQSPHTTTRTHPCAAQRTVRLLSYKTLLKARSLATYWRVCPHLYRSTAFAHQRHKKTIQYETTITGKPKPPVNGLPCPRLSAIRDPYSHPCIRVYLLFIFSFVYL